MVRLCVCNKRIILNTCNIFHFVQITLMMRLLLMIALRPESKTLHWIYLSSMSSFKMKVF